MLPLWGDLTSQISIRCRPNERGNETEERGTKRQEGSFSSATSERESSDVALSDEAAMSNQRSYCVPEEGCAASNCKSFCPRTECAARVPRDEGENICPVSRLSFNPAHLAFGRSDSKPTVRRDTDDRPELSRVGSSSKSAASSTRIAESDRRRPVRTKRRTDPRTIWQEKKDRFPTCDPPRSGSGHT